MDEKLIRKDPSFFGRAGAGDKTPGAEPGWKTGDLPGSAPLAAGYVPEQRSARPVYEAADALTRGTLFPGLDLPFMNVVNKDSPYAGTHLGELMAISFVTHELTLYLDTHTQDREAFELLRNMLALKKEAHERYARLYGPVSADDMPGGTAFSWTRSPWPWETTGKEPDANVRI
ncbi:MAG: spore coat protein CotJB [Oscillospiraceae bacterium]|nr:spore coat protein CotJB [Oscillospiraceae bacterium]